MGTEADKAMAGRGWPRLGRFWTVPNIVTLSRLVLVVWATYLIVAGPARPDLPGGEPRTLLFILVVLAIATDWVDGTLARWSHTVSEWGKVLDPFVDKMGAGAVVLSLWLHGWLPAWFLMLIIGRDMLILLGGLILARKTGRIVVSLWSGKVAVTALAVTVLAALMGADAPVMDFCIWVTAGLLAYSYLRYLVRYFRLLRSGPLPVLEVEVVSSTEPDGVEAA